MECSNCSKKMIRVGTGYVLLTYPEQYPMKWWCKCGHEEDAGIDMGETIEQNRLRIWKEAQPDERRRT